MSETNELQDLLFHEKPVKILNYLLRGNDTYAADLAKKIDATYSHTVKILQRMENHELIEFEERGRKKYIHLTDIGEKVSTKLLEAYTEVQNT